MRDPKALLREIKTGLETLYGERLRGVYLYGSYARGEPELESDVDVLVVLDDVVSYAREIERTSELVGGLSLRYGVSVSRVFVPLGAWLQGDTPFLTLARSEAIPA